MTYKFTQVDKENIISKFGQDFYSKLGDLIELFSERWQVTSLELIQSFSVNLVLKGMTEKYGPVVMKIARDKDEFASEATALSHYNTSAICQLYEVDFNHMVLLEQAIEPGYMLVKEDNLNKRLDAFCSLFNGLHSMDENTNNYTNREGYSYRSYKDWIFRITDYMTKQDGWKALAVEMERAKLYFCELSETYNRVNLLHGDFHYYNIIKDSDGYTIIDPKGVIGDPVFDIPRYMLNEFWDEEDDDKVDQTVEQVFKVLSEVLNVPIDVLSKLLYLEGVMSVCWNVEDGMSLSEKDETLETVAWLHKYVNKYNGGE